MTITAIIAAQSIGTGANKGNGKFPTKLTLAATAAKVSINATLTNGAAPVDPNQRPRIWYAFSAFSITAAAAVQQLAASARYLDIIPSPTPSALASRSTDAEWARGLYLYVWVDAPTYTVAGSLDVTTAELLIT